MKESVIYQDIWEQSKQETTLNLCMYLIKQSFAEFNSNTEERIKSLSVEKLKVLFVYIVYILYI